jgi:predicted lipoprotein
MRRPVPLLFIGVCLLASCVIVRHEDKNAGGAQKDGLEIYFANGSFNAKAYVEGLWEARLLPYAREAAVDLAALTSELKADEAAASAAHGKRQVAEGAPFNFSAKGEAVVLAAHTALPGGNGGP